MIKIAELAECHIKSGDGDTVETAFVFDSDYTDAEAVTFEYAALSKLYGYENCDFVQQKFFMKNDKCYDAIVFNKFDTTITVYFDITKHFGK